MFTEWYDKSKRCGLADLEKNLLTLRKQKLPYEHKTDGKKSKGEADLEKLAKIHLFLEQVVNNPDLKKNLLTFRKVVWP